MKPILSIGMAALLMCGAAYADDSQRIEQLESKVQEIEARLSELEAVLSNPSAEQKHVISGEGWKSVANWRKLAMRMSYDDVRVILGEPNSVRGGTLTRWEYPRGRVDFFNGQVEGWSER